MVIEFACVNCQIFHDCMEGEVLIVGGSKLMASLLGANFSATGFLTSLRLAFWKALDIDFRFQLFRLISGRINSCIITTSWRKTRWR